MNKRNNTIVIENPSPVLLDFVRGLERRKTESKKDLKNKKDKYFPKK